MQIFLTQTFYTNILTRKFPELRYIRNWMIYLCIQYVLLCKGGFQVTILNHNNNTCSVALIHVCICKDTTCTNQLPCTVTFTVKRTHFIDEPECISWPRMNPVWAIMRSVEREPSQRRASPPSIPPAVGLAGLLLEKRWATIQCCTRLGSTCTVIISVLTVFHWFYIFAYIPFSSSSYRVPWESASMTFWDGRGTRTFSRVGTSSVRPSFVSPRIQTLSSNACCGNASSPSTSSSFPTCTISPWRLRAKEGLAISSALWLQQTFF